MKTRNVLFSIAVGLLLISGCIPSLHPLYTEDDLIFDEILLGSWQKNDEQWTFAKENDNSYHLQIVNQEDTSNLFVHMLSLGGFNFLDFYPANNDHVDIPDYLMMNLLPVHTFARFSYDNESIHVNFFDPDWLAGLFEHNRIRIRHEVLADDNIVLTASTEELQKFVTKYADDPDAFTGTDTFNRIR